MSSRKKIDTEALKRTIPGWGADLDPANRPGVPKESNRVPATLAEHVRLERQKPPHRIHLTVERPELTPVFGTSCPPRLLSGKMRDFAYRFGEGRLARWMTLLAADRVDMLEGAALDLLQGRLPHPVREMGLRTELEERGRLARAQRSRSLAVGAGLGALAALGAGLLFARESRRDTAA
jgi:hypothetical protein